MAFPNGRIPADRLTRIPARHYTHDAPTYLRDDAAASFARVAALYEQRFGAPMRGISFYRTYERQREIFLERYVRTSQRSRARTTDRYWDGTWWRIKPGYAVSAVPGYSNHGAGVAMDLTDGIQTRGTTRHTWWAGIAREHGWTIRYDIGEPWHAEYDPARDKHRGQKPVSTSKPAVSAASTEETELMAAKDDIIREIHGIPARVWGGPGAPMVNRRFEGGSEYPETTLGSMTDRIVRQQIIPMRAEIAALTTAVQQLATAQGVDPAAVERAVRDAVAHALDGAQVTATISRD